MATYAITVGDWRPIADVTVAGQHFAVPRVGLVATSGFNATGSSPADFNYLRVE